MPPTPPPAEAKTSFSSFLGLSPHAELYPDKGKICSVKNDGLCGCFQQNVLIFLDSECRLSQATVCSWTSITSAPRPEGQQWIRITWARTVLLQLLFLP